MTGSVYQSDPGAAPDSGFVPGGLRHLVAGNRGRLLDARRTPVRVTAVRAEAGFFEVEVQAFEDAGARWLVPVESAGSYQFAAGGATAAGTGLRALRAAAARCDVQVSIAAGPAARGQARRRLAAERVRAGRWLTGHGAPAGFDPGPFIDGRAGWPQAQRWLGGYLAGRGLAAIEDQISAGYVSNPWAGDLVLGHLIVLAELGFGPLTARAPRDPEIFAGDWTKPRRAGHILARMGFTQALWRRAHGPVTLYRGAALPGQPATAGSPGQRRSPLISASFSREVADSHFQSQQAAALYRQPLAPGQLFMTFLETAAMNRQFREAEAVLLTGQHLPPPAA